MKRALVCGAGGSKGAFVAGAVQYLSDENYTFDVVAGVSSGALNAVMIGQNNINDLVNLWEGLTNKDVYTDSIKNPVNIFNVLFGHKEGIYNNKPLRRLLEKWVDPDKVEIPTYFGTVSLNTGEYLEVCASPGRISVTGRETSLSLKEEYINYKKIFIDLLLGSTAIPVVFPPVLYRTHKLVDGGIRDLTPLRSVIDHSPDEIIIVNCNPLRMLPNNNIKGIGDIASMAIGIATNEIFNNDIKEFLRVNELVKQASERGFVLTNPDGKEYKHFKHSIIEPAQDLGDSMNFNKGADKVDAGYFRAMSALNGETYRGMQPWLGIYGL